MKLNWSYIKIGLLLVLVVFLYAFSSARNSVRKVSKPIVNFVGEDNLFITHEAVSKLLIQSQETVANKRKDIIDLYGLESALNSNAIIKQAQVYLSVTGNIVAEVEQKQPIARVRTNASYYIDRDGGAMPLSKNYTARVPLVTGSVLKNDLKNVYQIAQKVADDAFLNSHVVEIHQNENATIDLKFRLHDFNIHLGSLNLLDKKINNLKAFYQKAYKDKTLDSYSVVNLKFDNQVICTKK
ncbi:cell division protein FtsQ/DivIB [Lacinutrix undariae]